MKPTCLIAALSLIASYAPAAPIQPRESKELGGGLGRAWIVAPAHTKPKAVLICLHGIQSNRDWWLPLGRELAGEGIAVWAYNRPGSGNPVPEGPARVSGKSWDAQMKHVREAARAVHGDIPAYAVGVSWGASPALVAVRNNPGDWQGAILLNPAFKTTKDDEFKRATVPHFLPWGWFTPVTLPLEWKDYTTRPSTVARYLQSDQLKKTATLGFMLRTNSVKKAAIKALPKIDRPALVLVGYQDPLVTPRLFSDVYPGEARWNPQVTVTPLPMTHAGIVEPERTLVAGEISKWVRAHSK